MQAIKATNLAIEEQRERETVERDELAQKFTLALSTAYTTNFYIGNVENNALQFAAAGYRLADAFIEMRKKEHANIDAMSKRAVTTEQPLTTEDLAFPQK